MRDDGSELSLTHGAASRCGGPPSTLCRHWLRPIRDADMWLFVIPKKIISVGTRHRCARAESRLIDILAKSSKDYRALIKRGRGKHSTHRNKLLPSLCCSTDYSTYHIQIIYRVVQKFFPFVNNYYINTIVCISSIMVLLGAVVPYFFI